jgi:hypothetical protein
VTQQYIVGELSVRIAELRLGRSSPLEAAVQELQRRVERAPFWSLAALVCQAIDVADTACWGLLEGGDVEAFRQEAARAADLREFASCAGLLP